MIIIALLINIVKLRKDEQAIICLKLLQEGASADCRSCPLRVTKLWNDLSEVVTEPRTRHWRLGTLKQFYYKDLIQSTSQEMFTVFQGKSVDLNSNVAPGD